MTDPRLAWFGAGAVCTAVLFGWPWHPWFSRRMGPPKGNYGLPPNHSWRHSRSINYPDPAPDRQPTNPFTGDPVKPQPHGSRIVRDDRWDPSWSHHHSTGYQPRPQGGTPNPPPTDP